MWIFFLCAAAYILAPIILGKILIAIINAFTGPEKYMRHDEIDEVEYLDQEELIEELREQAEDFEEEKRFYSSKLKKYKPWDEDNWIEANLDENDDFDIDGDSY